MSPSTTLTKRPSDMDLMPPPPPPKRIRRPAKVLDEDTYTDALSHIIARDFFPGLLETETQQEYLDALDAGDAIWIGEAEQKVRAAMTPGRRGRRGVSMTPTRREIMGMETPTNWMGTTPQSIRGSVTPASSQIGSAQGYGREKNEVDLNMGLTAFQAKYTSEDNESFNKVLDKQNEKRAEKYRWMWNGNKLPSRRQIAQAAVQQKQLESAATSTSAEDNTNQALVLQPRPSEDQDLRPAMISQLRSSGPRNNFMFTPADVGETHPHLTTISQAAQDASSAPPKSVSYDNTRLSTLSFPDSTANNIHRSTVPESPSLSAIDAAIAGRPRHRVDSTIAPGSETPRVNGYAFVDAEPTPSELGIPTSTPPQDDNTNNLLQQLILSSSSGEHGGGGTNPFTIHESSKRESLHHRMVEKTLAAKRSSGVEISRLAHLQHTSANGRTPTPKFASSPRITRSIGASATPVATPRMGNGRTGGGTGGLTPAALDLYSRLGKTPRGGSMGGGVFDLQAHKGKGQGEGKGSWTPTPLRAKRVV